MRKPRDIDAELQALTAKAQKLKNRKVAQLGELVIATGADALEPELLAGALLAAVNTRDLVSEVEWKGRGEAFFRKRAGRSPARQTARDPATDGKDPGPPAAR